MGPISDHESYELIILEMLRGYYFGPGSLQVARKWQWYSIMELHYFPVELTSLGENCLESKGRDKGSWN